MSQGGGGSSLSRSRERCVTSKTRLRGRLGWELLGAILLGIRPWPLRTPTPL